MEPEDLPYHHTKIPPNVPEKTNFLNEIEKEFHQDLLNNPKYKVFFDRFQQNTIEQFCKNYSVHKRHLIEMYSYYTNILQTSKELRYREEAEDIFELILQKKLFNLQLLWRAEKITLPEIKLSVDFNFWGGHIEHCSFLEEVSPAEISAMQQFLKDENYSVDLNNWFSAWQDYDSFIQQNENDDREYMPEWYEFYDGHLGTGVLLLLPDTRGEKEEQYRQALFASQREKAKSEPTPPPGVPFTPPPPYLFCSPENYCEFITLFENEYFARPHKGYMKGIDKIVHASDTFDREAVDSAIDRLAEAEIPLIIKGGQVWHEAIIRCARQYTNSIIADELDVIYNEYLLKRELKISNQASDMQEEYDKDILHKMVMEQILQARALLNEPKDLNF